MSSLLAALLLALALVAVLAGLRLFLVRPRERAPDYRAALDNDTRATLRELLSDPGSVAGRKAERQGDWVEARAAYTRVLDELRHDAPDDPTVALKRRALESKLEELDRLQAGKASGD